MDRMKTFFKYFLVFIFLYFFVNAMTYINIRASLSDIELAGIEFGNPSVTIDEAKASRVNAIVKGKIKVDEENPVGFKYIRADFLSERDNILNSKFIDLEGLQAGEERDFSINTSTENVKKIKLVLTDIKETGGFEANMQEFSRILVGVLLAYLLLT